MSHDAHAHEVHDTLATRLLGITAGIMVFGAVYALSTSMGWHQAACSVLSGVMGVVFGAGGTSAYGGARAAVFAYIGVVNFVMGLAIFFGLVDWLF
ncbi:MAG: hypothetical protein FGM24_06110 [Candidatus Kapabacteria bacterium]|nr:hypothetical protein [Candidatus Kapabacteria bacterium]